MNNQNKLEIIEETMLENISGGREESFCLELCFEFCLSLCFEE
ncbi:hypothetical protein [Shewanella sp. NIFS-20-20]|nr:hypothetical protein [Shewanella sp. NIFS-20-20]